MLGIRFPFKGRKTTGWYARVLGGHPGSKREHRIIVSAGAGVFQRLMQVLSTLLLMPLLLRTLGPAKFGIWGAAASLAWLAGFADIGTGSALVTLVARSIALEDTNTARRQIGGALGLGCAIAGLVGLAAVAAALFIPPHGPMASYLIAIIGLALNIPMSAANNIWMALQKGYFSSLWELAQTLLTLGGLVVTAAASTDVRVYVAVVYGGLLLANAGSLIHLFWRHPELRPDGLLVPLAAIREVAGQGILYFALGLIGSLTFLLDNVLTLALLGPEASARMTIALRMCFMGLTSLGVASQPLWPAFAEAAENQDRHWIRSILFRGSAVLVGMTIVGSTLVLVFGERFLRWWLPDTLGIDQALLLAVAVWVLALALIRVPALLLNALSILRYQLVAVTVATTLAFALKFFLSRRLGVAGILWGTSASTLLVLFPAVTWRVFRWGRKPFPCGADPAQKALVP
jgi:O-antigen/teichoic acid export membrane protein